MNSKIEQKSLFINKLEVLVSRLPRSFPKLQLIENDIANLYKKFHLKQKIDYYLKLLPKKFSIINNICLRNKKQFHIDTLIITPHALFIIQVENTHTVPASLTYLNKQRATYFISKIKTTKLNLLQWLQKRGLNFLPIYLLIVISNSSLQLLNKESQLNKKVTLAKHLPDKIMNYYKQLKQFNIKNNEAMYQIINAIHGEKESCFFNIFKHYDINKNNILTGVRCKVCHTLGMKWINNFWECPNCKTKLKFAHKEALNDYFTLLNHSICKRECKWFLNVQSTETVIQILKEEKLPYNTTRKE